MPLFVDRHEGLKGVTPREAAEAHMKDLEVWAAEVQRRFEERNGTTLPELRVRIGMSAGEPVAEGDDLFGATVQLAARLCDHAQPGAVLVAGAVRDLALGKGFRFRAHDPVPLKGFPEPVRPFELMWRA